jgi:hypothetical protein
VEINYFSANSSLTPDKICRHIWAFHAYPPSVLCNLRIIYTLALGVFSFPVRTEAIGRIIDHSHRAITLVIERKADILLTGNTDFLRNTGKTEYRKYDRQGGTHG